VAWVLPLHGEDRVNIWPFPLQGLIAYPNFFIRIFPETCDKPAAGKEERRNPQGSGLSQKLPGGKPLSSPGNRNPKEADRGISRIFEHLKTRTL
jgi:hypothetical protein